MWLGVSIPEAFSEANLLPLGLQHLELLYDCRHDLEQVSDNAKVCDLKGECPEVFAHYNNKP